MEIQLLWDGCGIMWNPTLLLQLNFVTLLRRFETIAKSFSHQSKVSRVYEIYEKIFTTNQFGKPLSEYYSTLEILSDQLLQYQPFTIELKQ